jgi:hypothetical protein
MRRRLVATLIVLAICAVPSPALAQPDSKPTPWWAGAPATSGGVTVKDPGTLALTASDVREAGVPVVQRRSGRTCSYEDRTQYGKAVLPPNPGGPGSEGYAEFSHKVVAGEMLMVHYVCTNADGSRDEGYNWYEPGASVTGGAIAGQVEAGIRNHRLPGPSVSGWPRLDSQVVNVETWLHVDSDAAEGIPFAAPLQFTLPVGGSRVTAWASATAVTWTFQPDSGDQEPVTKTCAEAGKAWVSGLSEKDPDRCAVRFWAKQTGTVTVTISYSVPWQANTGEFNMVTIVDAARRAGGRIIVVDAIDGAAKRFYEHHDFVPVPGDDHRLVLKLDTAAKALAVDWP